MFCLGPVANLSPCAQSLREVIHDDNVRPKLQCLMMDSSFSMVTMQGEDSGIAWETTPNRCSAPWAPEGGSLAVDLGSQLELRPSTPMSASAGKIIFVMDEEMMRRRKRSKESDQKRRQDRQREAAAWTSIGTSERPELVEVSLPNVKTEECEADVPNDPPADKEQRLFRLVSEGSEILNIVVPAKLATVDEEESGEMEDNLSYLEESLVSKASEETPELQQMIPTAAPSAGRADPIRAMDPPGAPVTRPPNRRASGVVDYFEAYTLIDAQAPGGPAAIVQEVERKPEVAMETQDTEPPHRSTTGTTAELERSETVDAEEFTPELLDEVFYGGTEEKPEGPGDVARGTPSKGPAKPSGSILFGGEEDVLTPVYLPDGPPKIIDPILLEEPKAMAFLYTDLYEEALGCWTKEADRESVGSEKSFHSRHSDREARGYLEKYVLIDETPVVEMEAADQGKHPEEGPRVLSLNLSDYSNLRTQPENVNLPDPVEEITDFFRSSASSSPCELEPLDRLLKMEEAQEIPETKGKTKKVTPIEAKPESEDLGDPLSISDFECPYEELDWGITDDHLAVADIKTDGTDQEMWRDSYAQTPVAPPRKKKSSPKTCLDLSPLTPVDVQEKEAASEKEQGDEEKEIETHPQAKNTDQGDGGEAQQTCSGVPTESLSAAAETPQSESARFTNEPPSTHTASPTTEENEAEQETSEAKDLTEHAEPGDDESNKESGSQKGNEGSLIETDPAKEKGRCIIL